MGRIKSISYCGSHFGVNQTSSQNLPKDKISVKCNAVKIEALNVYIFEKKKSSFFTKCLDVVSLFFLNQNHCL